MMPYVRRGCLCSGQRTSTPAPCSRSIGCRHMNPRRLRALVTGAEAPQTSPERFDTKGQSWADPDAQEGCEPQLHTQRQEIGRARSQRQAPGKAPRQHPAALKSFPSRNALEMMPLSMGHLVNGQLCDGQLQCGSGRGRGFLLVIRILFDLFAGLPAEESALSGLDTRLGYWGLGWSRALTSCQQKPTSFMASVKDQLWSRTRPETVVQMALSA